MAKARLAIEVLLAYVRVRWSFAGREIEDAVVRIRTSRPVRPPSQAARDDEVVGQRLGYAVRRTLHPLPTDSRCLMSSLTLTALLARRGIDSSLVIGVRPGPSFEAHAWVERDGVPLTWTGDGTFERLKVL